MSSLHVSNSQVHVKGLSPAPCEYMISRLLHISTSYASPEFTLGICCLLLHLQVVSPISPISYLLGGSECSSFLVPEPPLTIRFGSISEVRPVWPSPYLLDQCWHHRALELPWISLMFVAVLSFSFWEPEQGLYSKSQWPSSTFPWLAWVNIGGEAEFGAFDNWHWKHNLTNWIHRRSSSNIIYTILEVHSYLLGCY